MSNFLDMRCPTCGGEDHIDLQATRWVRVCDDGFDDDVPNCGGHEFEPTSAALCRACGHPGTVWEFKQARGVK